MSVGILSGGGEVEIRKRVKVVSDVIETPLNPPRQSIHGRASAVPPSPSFDYAEGDGKPTEMNCVLPGHSVSTITVAHATHIEWRRSS